MFKQNNPPHGLMETKHLLFVNGYHIQLTPEQKQEHLKTLMMQE